LRDPPSSIVDLDDYCFLDPLHAHFPRRSPIHPERVFEQQRKDVRHRLRIGSYYRKVGGNMASHWRAVSVQSLPRCCSTVSEQWSEFDTLSLGGSTALSPVCRAHGARPCWRDRLGRGLEERVEFFNRKLYILHEQQQIGRLSAAPQPSLQEAGMLRQAVDVVLSLLQQCKGPAFVVILSRSVSRL